MSQIRVEANGFVLYIDDDIELEGNHLSDKPSMTSGKARDELEDEIWALNTLLAGKLD